MNYKDSVQSGSSVWIANPCQIRERCPLFNSRLSARVQIPFASLFSSCRFLPCPQRKGRGWFPRIACAIRRYPDYTRSQDTASNFLSLGSLPPRSFVLRVCVSASSRHLVDFLPQRAYRVGRTRKAPLHIHGKELSELAFLWLWFLATTEYCLWTTYENWCHFLKITPKFGSTHNGSWKFWKRLVIKVLQNALTLPFRIHIEPILE